jgi:hypothetical protein
MECIFGDRAYRIDFYLDMKATDIIDQVAFIILVSRRFNGKVDEPSRFRRGDGKDMGCIFVQFADFDTWDGAKAHCDGHLDRAGQVQASYVGALERADPGLGQAHALLKRLRARKSN